MRNLVVLGGSSHPEFTEQICNRLGISPGQVNLGKFSNNETSVVMKESVREQDVYIIQSACGNVNDNFIELLIMINACKIASAKRITAVIPNFPYSRQSDVPYKTSGAPLTFPASSGISTPISEQPFPLETTATTTSTNSSDQQDRKKRDNAPYRQWRARPGVLIADLLTAAGVDHIITMDLHDPQFSGFFDCPVDNLTSLSTVINYIRLDVPNYEKAIIVSPDAGGAKRAASIAEKLCMDFALVHKERPKVHSQKRESILVGDVRGRDCILIDDITDTAYTITKAARLLREKGAKKISAIVSHAILSADAIKHLEQSAIDELIASNSVPHAQHSNNSSKLKVFDVTRLFSEAIRRTHFGESLSKLFEA
ncbi:phosphoribosyltransferase-like protein [Mycotypha africana]|uniref:phosphoribosyltransferase-like protein n=1 Tax=Mycotypha africana TaxID=64632 RepID=UPI002301B7A9|nr:phosphoribosyltransferase-like protein [Mycotypha africana]KAI8977060.1 phosphoribosyltransferase-like protein [Mycotypha africana]